MIACSVRARQGKVIDMSISNLSNRLNDEEWSKLVEHLVKEDTPESTGLLLLACLGVRTDELCRITLDDISDEEIKITAAKKGIDRKLPVGKSLTRAARKAIEQAKTSTVGGLFSSGTIQSQKRIIRKYFDKTIRALFGRKDYSVHALRHSYAVKLLKQFDGDIRKVSLALGHQSPTSTYFYLDVLSFDDMRKGILSAIKV